MQLTRMIERSFHADTEAECKDWIRCYREVQKKLNEEVGLTASDFDPMSTASSTLFLCCRITIVVVAMTCLLSAIPCE